MSHSNNLAKYFRDLDKSFLGIFGDLKDEVLSFNGRGILVQKSYELPLQQTLPGSTISYEFLTESGCINFGVLFLSGGRGDGEEDHEVFAEQKSDGAGAELIVAIDRDSVTAPL